MQFRSIKAAKDYLVERIVAEAARKGVALSKEEREMLYFKEDGGLSKHMDEVSEAFERQCDDQEYEAKIAGLVRSLKSHNSREQQQAWDDAVLKVSEGDHYLLALVGGASPAEVFPSLVPNGVQRWLPALDWTQPRPPGDRLRLIIVGLIILIFIIVMGELSGHR